MASIHQFACDRLRIRRPSSVITEPSSSSTTTTKRSTPAAAAAAAVAVTAARTTGRQKKATLEEKTTAGPADNSAIGTRAKSRAKATAAAAAAVVTAAGGVQRERDFGGAICNGKMLIGLLITFAMAFAMYRHKANFHFQEIVGVVSKVRVARSFDGGDNDLQQAVSAPFYEADGKKRRDATQGFSATRVVL